MHVSTNADPPLVLFFKIYSGMGMEVCTTLGMLSPEQARRLKEAGLTAYNHNLDTSREYYPKVQFSTCFIRCSSLTNLVHTGHHNPKL